LSDDFNTQDYLLSQAEKFADLKHKLGDPMNRDYFLNSFK